MSADAERRERDDMTPGEIEDVAQRLRGHGFPDVAAWLEESAESMREADAR